MADYYSILNKTIAGLRENTPELRQAVYAKARVAIEGKLRKLDPFPGDEALRRQLELLEEAVIVVEAEHGSPPPPVVRQPEQAAPVNSAPPPSPPVGVPQPDLPQPDLPQTPVAETSIQPPSPEQVVSTESGSTPDIQANDQVTVSDSTPELPVDRGEPAAASLAPDMAVGSEIPSASPPPTVTSIPEPSVSSAPGPDPALSGNLDTAGIPEEMMTHTRPEKKKRGFGGILVTLVLMAILGGGAYAAWLNRDALSGMIAGFVGSEETAGNAENASVNPDGGNPQQATDKEETRIANQGQEEQATTEPIVVQPTPEPTLTPNEQPQEPTVPDVTVVEPVEVEPVTETPAVEEQAEGNTETAATDPGVGTAQNEPASLGEVAYLYEERGAGAGATRSNASISWKIAQVKPSSELPAEAVIVGNMSVPDKGLDVDINIKRNVDDALSASHIIELTFEVPTGFGGGTIDNIARFVMKPTEEARGEPLVAVPVKVSDGYFLIALDNLQQAVQVNQQLLLSSGWIDIPISYSSGKRALLTLSKGGTGQEVFRQAFDDWQTR